LPKQTLTDTVVFITGLKPVYSHYPVIKIHKEFINSFINLIIYFSLVKTNLLYFDFY